MLPMECLTIENTKKEKKKKKKNYKKKNNKKKRKKKEFGLFYCWGEKGKANTKNNPKKKQEQAQEQKQKQYILPPAFSLGDWQTMAATAIAVVVAVVCAISFFTNGGKHDDGFHGPGAHVGLVVMAKNENLTIIRLLESAKGHVQSFVICDTGSDDGTIETVNAFGDQIRETDKDFPFILVRHKWKDDFAYNRNLCLKIARKKVPKMEYILTIDADETMQVNDPNWRHKIQYDHNLIIYEGNNHHPLPRLISTRYDFKYVCVIHEVINYLPDTTTGTFYGVSIVNHADGQSSGENNRHNRNFRLLDKGLKRGAKDKCYTRYVFYMAEALYERGEWTNAATWHKKRVTLGGHKEEIYHSIYKLGMAMKQLGGLPLNISGIFLQAWESRPWRAEALYSLAEFHKNSRNYHNCKLFAEKAIMPFPRSDQLFVKRSIYAWEAYDMAGYCSYFIKEYAIAKKHWLAALEGLGHTNVDKINMLKKNIGLCDENLVAK